MPVYEYECSLCHLRFDRRQRFDEEPIAICPRCQGKARRVFHSVPILFRGSGFYATDYSQASETGDVKEGVKEEAGKVEVEKSRAKTGDEVDK